MKPVERQLHRELRPAPATDAAVATKAVLGAAERLGLSNKTLAKVIGVSEATVSRMSAGSYQLARGEKPFELALLFVRLFRSLDAIAGGDEAVTTAWMRSENLALGGTPVTLIQSIPGLVHVLAYLDARRSLA
jgi:DNA-binding XRE family transcriptional regulator